MIVLNRHSLKYRDAKRNLSFTLFDQTGSLYINKMTANAIMGRVAFKLRDFYVIADINNEYKVKNISKLYHANDMVSRKMALTIVLKLIKVLK